MSKPRSLVAKLFDGPVDIIGDIHGELGSLQALLFRLGYDGNGGHPAGRRLVFVGDLVDRGPDSVGVVRLVRSLVERGAAQMILGNHEVNLMRGEHKHGNHWFWGEVEHLNNKNPETRFPVLAPGQPSFQVLLQDDAEREAMVEFLRKQPLALESDGVKVVHAMWDEESVARLRGFDGNAAEAYKHFDALIKQKLATELAEASKDERDMAEQNENPVNVMTSGMEAPAKERFFAGGKWRTLDRHPWWEGYKGEAGLIVIGHYWRRMPASETLGFSPTGPSLFHESKDPTALLGDSGSVMCVDYSVGMRFEERGRGLPEGSLGTALAAFRLPERTLHFADGRPTVELGRGKKRPAECA